MYFVVNYTHVTGYCKGDRAMAISIEGWVLVTILVLLFILLGISMLASLYISMRKNS
jgi:hypothetical protein